MKQYLQYNRTLHPPRPPVPKKNTARHIRNMDAAIPAGRDTLFSPGTAGAAAAARPRAKRSTASGGGLCRDGGLCSISSRRVVSALARTPDAEEALTDCARRRVPGALVPPLVFSP